MNAKRAASSGKNSAQNAAIKTPPNGKKSAHNDMLNVVHKATPTTKPAANNGAKTMPNAKNKKKSNKTDF